MFNYNFLKTFMIFSSLGQVVRACTPCCFKVLRECFYNVLKNAVKIAKGPPNQVYWQQPGESDRFYAKS